MPDLIVLDESVAEGFKAAAGGWNTKVVTGGGGSEYRNQQWAVSRRRYEFAFPNKDIADIKTLLDFVDDRRGMLHPWLLKDWANHRLTNEVILTAVGGETTAQIKQSAGTNNPFSRSIKHLKSGTLVVKRNGVTLTLTTDYSVSTTGLITFVSALSAADVITVTCEFYVKVRFEADLYLASVEGPQGRFGNIQSISAREVP